MPQAVVAVQAFIYGITGTAAAAAGFSSAAASAIATGAVGLATATAKVALLAGLNSVVANQNRPRPQGGLITLTINPSEPRRLQVGKRINGGVLSDWYVGGSKNGELFMIVYLGEGPMGQITKVFGGGREVYSTPLVHGTRTEIPAYRSVGDRIPGRLWITYYDGRPGQTANSYLVGKGLGWTSNHVGTGCAYAIIEAWWDSDNQTSPPQISFEIEGAKLYDRRKDTTAGGSGSHRANDPATWELSSNPAVALDHYLLGRYTGSVKTFGVGLDAEDVPYAEFAALANLCDENVTKKAGGTHKRYAANGFLFADRTYSDTIRDLCRAMNARPADFGGRIGIIDGEEKTPVLTIEDADVIESVPEAYNPKRSWADLVSVVRGTYQSPAQLYQAAEYPRVTDAAWTAADGGNPKEATLDLEMETDQERAQRLATLFALRERRQAQLSGTYALRTIELEQGDWFIRSGSVFGSSPGKVFEVIDRVLDPRTMTVTITAFEVDPDDSAWDETTAADPPPDPIPSTDELQAMEVPSLTVTGITLSGTAAQIPAIKVEWTEPTDIRVQQIVIEAVPEAGGVPTSAQVDWATGQVVFTSGITDDTDYLVRAKFVGDFIPSAWTSNVAVTTLGDYSVGEATSVPWSGLTGPIPATVDNDLIGQRASGLITKGNFEDVELGQWGGTDLTLQTFAGQPFTQALKSDRNDAFENIWTPVSPGEKVFGSAYLRTAGTIASAWLAIEFRDASETQISVPTLAVLAAGQEWTLVSGTPVTVPSGAVEARPRFQHGDDSGTYSAYMALPQILRHQTGADVTATNTAAGFTGQGALATLPNVTLGGSGLVRREDGTTNVTDAAAITSLGTAAAITGQGNQALANAARGNTASRPSSTGDYGWYANTETGFLQLDVPSVGWVDVAGIPAANFTASYSASPVNNAGTAASFATGSIAVNTTGLTGGKTYETAIIDSSSLTPKVSVSGVTGSSFTLQAAGFAVSESETGTVRTIVTDTTTGRTTIVQAAYSMTRTS